METRLTARLNIVVEALSVEIEMVDLLGWLTWW
jgi:hypothetical protein